MILIQVSKIMQPRVDIVGVPETSTAAEILQVLINFIYLIELSNSYLSYTPVAL